MAERVSGLEQVSDLDAEGLREFMDVRQGDVVFTTLDCACIGAVDACTVCQCFLAPPTVVAEHT
jgi:hypothetical protein